MEKVRDKITIGTTYCYIRESSSGFYLENPVNHNSLLFQQFGLTKDFLCELSRTGIKGGSGSFPYHATLFDLHQTIKLLKAIEKLGNNWRDNLVKWKLTPDNPPKYDLIVGDRVSCKQFMLFHYGLCLKSNITDGRLEFVHKKEEEKEIYPAGTRLVGFTKAGRDITSFKDTHLGYFLVERAIRLRESGTSEDVVQIWDNHGFLKCFAKDLKEWEEPKEIVSTSNVFDKDALEARKDELLVMESTKRRGEMAKAWANAAIIDEIEHFPRASRIGKPMLWGTSGSDAEWFDYDSLWPKPCRETALPAHIKYYPLMPSEAFKGKAKTVLVSPIKIKKRPLI